MDKRQHEAVKLVKRELKHTDWIFHQLVVGKRHIKIYVFNRHTGERRFLVCSKSPSCHRAQKNMVATCRRLIEE
jgi:hypothetical protein